MQETPHFDLIVIGAGNAGLAAALTAAGLGKRVLVVEKNLYPGGSAASFRRGRFEFEVPINVESDSVGGVRIITEKLYSILKDFNLDMGLMEKYLGK